MIDRRAFIGALGLGVGAPLIWLWPEQGVWNECSQESIPEAILQHELLREALDGIRPQWLWDCHTHLIGTGDSDSEIWINPQLQSLLYPIKYIQTQFYFNASCVVESEGVDKGYVKQLLHLKQAFPQQSRLMLMAFDHFYDERGTRNLDRCTFYTPNRYAARIAKLYPQHFEWIASVHPYRPDAVALLHRVVRSGARAVKWLPPAQGMNPSSPLCDRFYQTMVELSLPLLVHAGDEHAVDGQDAQSLGNPLLLRRALDHGVRVIVAHCASQGSNTDLDRGTHAAPVSNFELFARLMDEPRYERLLYGDISAMTQINRVGPALSSILERDHWHHRLANGSDYPLPGVIPLFSMRQLLDKGYLTEHRANFCSLLRRYNPLLADLIIKRLLAFQGHRFSTEVFESRRIFEPHIV